MEEGADEGAQHLKSEINPEHFMPKTRFNPALDRLREARGASNVQGEQPPAVSEEQASAESGQNEISIKVFFTNMSEWISIQKQLSKTDGVKSIRIVSLKTNQVDVIAAYNDWNRFTTSLQSNGLTLELQSGRDYILKRIGGNF